MQFNLLVVGENMKLSLCSNKSIEYESGGGWIPRNCSTNVFLNDVVLYLIEKLSNSMLWVAWMAVVVHTEEALFVLVYMCVGLCVGKELLNEAEDP